MKIIFEGEGRKYEAIVDSIEDVYDAIKDGLVAMSYCKETAEQFIKEFKEDEED